MASERQIAANQRNARRSTGPRSSAAKKRSAQNAYRHGLSASSGSLAAFAKQLERLTHKIAGNTTDVIVLERARAAAQAELDLARVRRAKVALIECVAAFANLHPSQLFGTGIKNVRPTNAFDQTKVTHDQTKVTQAQPIDSAATMPSPEPDRSAEAIRRALPDLLKLNRYERRASARRDRAIRTIAKK